MAIVRIILMLIFLVIGLNFAFYALLTPFFMLWVGDAPSYSDEYTRNHMLISLGYGLGAATIAAASLYTSYSLFWNKINLWSKISFGVVILTLILFLGFFGIATLTDGRY